MLFVFHYHICNKIKLFSFDFKNMIVTIYEYLTLMLSYFSFSETVVRSKIIIPLIFSSFITEVNLHLRCKYVGDD